MNEVFKLPTVKGETICVIAVLVSLAFLFCGSVVAVAVLHDSSNEGEYSHMVIHKLDLQYQVTKNARISFFSVSKQNC